MIVKIKKLSKDVSLPFYAKEGDAGMDLIAVSKTYDAGQNYIEFGTGLCIEIPVGYVGLIYPRSSISNKCLMLYNSVGVIDSGYKNEIKLRFKPTKNKMSIDDTYNIGDKIGQLIIMPYPQITFEEVEELTGNNRGGGFGSTGK